MNAASVSAESHDGHLSVMRQIELLREALGFDGTHQSSNVKLAEGRRFRVEIAELPPVEKKRDLVLDGMTRLGITYDDVDQFDRCGDTIYIDCKDGRSFMFDIGGK